MKRILLILLPILLLVALAAEAQVGLKDAYDDYFTIGAAVNVTNVTIPRQAALIRRNFNSITAEDDMKPAFCHPSENVWDWSKADSIADFCRRNGIRMRGHVLMWHTQFSDWMYTDAFGQPVTKEKFYERLRTHIHTIMNRYKDVVYAWDVVNEVVAEDDQADLASCPYRKSKAYLLCGEEYISKAFEFAHEADSDAVLMFNDYNTCKQGKRDRMYKILKKLIDAGVPVTGIGMQGHYNVSSPTASELDKTITLFSTLTKHIHITELDLSCNKSSGQTLSDAEKRSQEKVFSAYFKVFRSHKDVIDNVTFWNLYDRESWIGSYNCPLLWDQNLHEKDAYYTVRDFKSSTSSDALIAARLAFKNAKSRLKEYASYLDSEGFCLLGQSLLDFLEGYTPSGENVDAYNRAAADMKSEIVAVQDIADRYLDILNDRRNLYEFADKTQYPGYAAFVSSLRSIIPSRTDVKDSTSLATVGLKLRIAKKDYLYSQAQPADGSGILVTKMLTNPWFCDEVAEPVSVEQGIANYYVDWARVYTTDEGWTSSMSDSQAQQTTNGYYQSRTAWMGNYKSDMADGQMDISQQITDLKPGFYTVSADMVSNVKMTDAFVYAQSGNSFYARSSSLGSKGWDGRGTNQGAWETLQTAKVYVGQGDTLAVGACSTGEQKKGLYCVTNFQLRYYGVDVTEEVQTLIEEIRTQIQLLKLKGDVSMADGQLMEIIDSDMDNASRLNALLSLSNELDQWIKSENGFFQCKDNLSRLAVSLTDAKLSGIVGSLDSMLTVQCSTEDVTYADLSAMTNQCSAMILYIDVAAYAVFWDESSVQAMLNTQIAEIQEAASSQKLLMYSDQLRQAMRSTISSFTASASAPIDVTFLIKDPSFSSGEGTYWKGTTPQISACIAEFSGEKSFDMFQIIQSVPNGRYRLEVNAFYRDGTANEAYNRYPRRSVKGSCIYLNYIEKYISPWASESSMTQYTDDDCTFNGFFYYPSSALSADGFFRDGYYLNTVEATISDSLLLVGISKTANVQNDWTVCDCFTLYYLGEDVTPTDDVHYVTVGEKGNVSYPFWQEFSSYYTVKQGMTGHFQFMNYSDMVNNYDNWILAVTNRPDHNTGTYQDYEEFLILRADWYGWGTCFGNATLFHDFNTNNFKQDMNGALVDMYITYSDSTVNVASTITTNAENADISTHKTYRYSMSGAKGITGDQIYVYFSVEKANLQGTNPIATDIAALTDNRNLLPFEILRLNSDSETQTHESPTYNLAGQTITENYRGIVIKDGRKYLKK